MKSNTCKRETWKPAVPKSVLLMIAGGMWMGTAILMDSLSYSWLREGRPETMVPAVTVGCLCALLIHHFGFLRIVNKNVARIHSMEGRQCVFAFMSWKSYLLVAVMIFMGVSLRHSPVPKLYLAVLYAAIGTALLLSSVRYLRYSLAAIKNGAPANRTQV